MASTPIRALFLDIGGVLLTNGWDRTMRRRAAETFGLDYDDMNERHHLTFDTYEQGKLSLQQYLQRVIFFKPRPFTPEDFRAFMFAQSQPIPEMIELVKRLKDRYRLRVAAVSNEGRELTLHRIETFGLQRFIDLFVCSCFVHFRKPDADIYRAALDMAAVAADEVVYIDDRQLFVEVAEGLGIPAICHIGYNSTRDALAARGLTAG